ncbi:hypothetical protein [Sulfurimonas sp.]|uniref:hypothetical protein n=1 Tax=Sulfurimonas sp. TaxID=2022749 RepID=UPI003D12B1F5
MEITPGTFIGLSIITFGIILSIGKYQYERNLKNAKKELDEHENSIDQQSEIRRKINGTL